jgi:indole-3-glycerol phosphate synthase
MNILEQIISHKHTIVARRKQEHPLAELERAALFSRPVISFRDSLLDHRKTGIIAEFKRKSPSKGFINAAAQAGPVTADYEACGASALSVLTDLHYFGGTEKDIADTGTERSIPLLRKEFIIDEYQVAESRAMGADVILLIASVLTSKRIKVLSGFAKSLGLQVLLEVHSRDEISSFNENIEAIGVNNRNLKTFSTDIQQSIDLYPYLPADTIKISESGINKPADLKQLRAKGYDGFLIGELFMSTQDPGKAFREFAKQCIR